MNQNQVKPNRKLIGHGMRWDPTNEKWHPLGCHSVAYEIICSKINAVGVHYLGPGCREIANEFPACVGLCIDFGQGAQLGV